MLTFFVVDFALFLLYVTENELATPPLDGIILPGVTRQSILDLARNWVSFFGHASSGFNSRKIYWSKHSCCSLSKSSTDLVKSLNLNEN